MLAKHEKQRREEHIAEGRKPLIVEMNMEGRVDARCEGHLKWQKMLRFHAPRLLNLGEVYLKNQVDEDISKLQAIMDASFEYQPREIIEKDFKEMVTNMLRNKRCQMKGKRMLHPKKKPLSIQEAHWDALINYLDKIDTIELYDYMSEVRKLSEERFMA